MLLGRSNFICCICQYLNMATKVSSNDRSYMNIKNSVRIKSESSVRTNVTSVGSKNKKSYIKDKLMFPRLNIPQIENEVTSKVDLDPLYYSLIAGRPIKPNTSIRMYKENIRNVTLFKVVAGFTKEEMLRREQEHMEEQKKYEEAVKCFQECSDSFDKFLNEDNNKAIVMLKKSEQISQDLAANSDELKKLTYEHARLKSKVHYTDQLRHIMMAYKHFFYLISPIPWRKENDPLYANKTREKLKINVMDFETNHAMITTDEAALIKLRDEVAKCTAPKLYFTDPGQIQSVFEMLEVQNLNYLLITEEMHAQTLKVLSSTKRYKDSCETEYKILDEQVEQMEESILVLEANAITLQKIFYRIMKNKFYDQIASKAVLQLYTYVEFVYKEQISTNEINMSTYDMMLAIETEYNGLLSKFESINVTIAKPCMTEKYKEDIVMMRNAYKASKKLKNFDKIRKRLQNAAEPNYRQSLTKLPYFQRNAAALRIKVGSSKR